MPPHRKRPAARLILNGKKLQEFRLRAGLSLSEMEELSGIPRSSVCDYEHGHTVPQLHRFKKLCEVYRLDVLETADLLGLRVMDFRTIRAFRKACQQEGTTPAQALRDFITVYAED
jgi:transcriptional regulator with XRE-family HTH domain